MRLGERGAEGDFPEWLHKRVQAVGKRFEGRKAGANLWAGRCGGKRRSEAPLI